jgi:hypothetical protein
MYLEYGIEEYKLEEYLKAMSSNFYKTRFYFGDLKVAVAQDSHRNTVYEVVYLDINDSATNRNDLSVAPTFYINNKTYHPASITNMRTKFSQLSVLAGDQYKQVSINEQDLPLFMRTPQSNNYKPSNYSPVVVLCYALPGQGTRLANRIHRSGFDFKQFSFEVDRVVVQNSLDNTSAKYLLIERQSITDTIPSDSIVAGIDGFDLGL